LSEFQHGFAIEVIIFLRFCGVDVHIFSGKSPEARNLNYLHFFQFCVILIATTNEYPIIMRSKKEKEFVDPVTGNAILFPSIDDEPTVKLSVIVPAYNEEERGNCICCIIFTIYHRHF
jgi:hypothetical protein